MNSTSSGPDTRKPSHLFYQSRLRRPLVARAEGIYLWDQSGKRYIDGTSGPMCVNIGYGNPRVNEAIKRQLDQTSFAYRLHFENEAAEELARELTAQMPGDLDRAFFVSGGSEAVESCIKFARQYALATGQDQRRKVISRFPSYHGGTLGALAVTGYEPLTAPFAPMMESMPKIPAPTTYLDRDNLSPEQRGLKYADLLADAIEREGPESVLAFLMEPVGGASTGALVAPDSYYGRVAEICKQYGVLLIYDEVMSGAGRTGRYLAADHWGITPDIVALSKGLGAGYAPLGAMIARTPHVEAVLDAGGFMHGYTYAGNPLACAAGRAVLHELLDHNLMENATLRGEQIQAGLRRLAERFPFIGDVRGKGLLVAFELVSDRATMAVLPKELNAYQRCVDLAHEKGLIIYSRRTRGGIEGDHLLVCPPLIVTAAEVEEILSIIADTLATFAQESGLPDLGVQAA
ncbi:aminotransferase family protein [Limibacillus halophilus]|uniref:Adenosylmethionine-8-amino-7-oxononanoate aminotransferase n=1 Tax=Limibacillus halophilus TaxID=1579333 RepID=A0A839STY7_9PROT|nr:aspartate aminotransferase family protein [Limibacillus halophilus]MBB3065449.1 adenosylmethionine-8-amino-7-oxononanoate aminotransferase [Limibacillus halophilus]